MLVEKTVFPSASLIQGFHRVPALGLELPMGPGLGLPGRERSQVAVSVWEAAGLLAASQSVWLDLHSPGQAEPLGAWSPCVAMWLLGRLRQYAHSTQTLHVNVLHPPPEIPPVLN